MEKVKVSKEVAEEIERCMKLSTFEGVLKTHRIDDRLPQVLNEMNFNDLVIALYIGYEVERTPEERIKIQYEVPVRFFSDGNTDTDIYRKGIKFAINTLGIKIEGVSD